MPIGTDILPWISLWELDDGGAWEGRRIELKERRNALDGLPLVSYANQYAMACFEGLRAFPLASGGMFLFRPLAHGERFARSMAGLGMPPFPVDRFVEECTELVRLNTASANAGIYLRPFAAGGAGVGMGLSKRPGVYFAAFPFSEPEPARIRATTSPVPRAVPGGTGWIKCASNYTIAALEKDKALRAGFHEVCFLDSREGRYVEEGSIGNFFFFDVEGRLLSPALGDTILPGVTRMSLIELARGLGIDALERRISLEEAMGARSMWVSGTAAGFAPIAILAHKGREAEFDTRFEPALALAGALERARHGAEPGLRHWGMRIG